MFFDAARSSPNILALLSPPGGRQFISTLTNWHWPCLSLLYPIADYLQLFLMLYVEFSSLSFWGICYIFLLNFEFLSFCPTVGKLGGDNCFYLNNHVTSQLGRDRRKSPVLQSL